ncbi:VIT1/CCC1 transporter family protein [Falsarthrobacter nasiphocae]|uniref:VIT1/CCC1 family predicted Fe2+/Mn2+ transporter n=1 Tax=Falsarthrobacter nasiphocae TaxID=189863 RepID=A0AAE3YGB3_9MICC|nr:VIT1/CCC1 transporter family protein [Falsarthrobacter nasiphocae]MDR6891717.1 VIT1/CCC1 family predicted Fe2+/Mn2+ transporter [Falsarthrobacter nasiphocae]
MSAESRPPAADDSPSQTQLQAPGPAAQGRPASPSPTPAEIRRWNRYLADEIAERELYLKLAEKKTGEEKAILTELASAETRHAEHWRRLLGPHARPGRPSLRRWVMRVMAMMFGSIFVLALAQRAEGDSPYARDAAATPQMAADEKIHEEVVRGLATRGREALSGNFRAAVFGMNDGLVSNLALVLGIGATGVGPDILLYTGIAGLLAGALSMASGEFISVRSQMELLGASKPTQATLTAAPDLDFDANELELVYRARGMDREAARHRAMERLGYVDCDCDRSFSYRPEENPEQEVQELKNSAWGAAISSFLCFAAGALVPIIPFLFGASGMTGILASAGLVAASLFLTGGITGLLSGTAPLKPSLRQMLIGLAAAAVTYAIGLLIGGGAVV